MTKSVFSDHYTQFRQALTAARKGAGLTQVDLATRLNKPQSYISKIENGERRIDVVEFIAVARALGINPSILIDELSNE
jgi:transcriptional regulator with XRE-family HTH domain